MKKKYYLLVPILISMFFISSFFTTSQDNNDTYKMYNASHCIDFLKKANTQIVNLSNNHIFDWGDEAVLETHKQFNGNTAGCGPAHRASPLAGFNNIKTLSQSYDL